MVVFQLLRICIVCILALSGVTRNIFVTKRRLFLTFVFEAIIFPSSKEADDHEKCKEYERFNISIMDCRGLGENIRDPVPIPNGLSANIQGLNFSRVPISYHLKNDTFIKFKDSLLLLVTNNYIPPEANGVFLPLTKLQYLDISGGCFKDKRVYNKEVLPASLKVLRVLACDLYELDFRYLISLEEFYARGNNLDHVPLLDVKTPLKIVDLSINLLFTLSPVEFAPFCTLQEVIMETVPNRGLAKPKFYCNCTMFNNWFPKTKIKYTPIACAPLSPAPTCNTALLEGTASSIYAKCLPSKWKWWLVLPSILLLLLLTILTIAFCVMFVTRDDVDQRQPAPNEESIDAPVEEEEEAVEILE